MTRVSRPSDAILAANRGWLTSHKETFGRSLKDPVSGDHDLRNPIWNPLEGRIPRQQEHYLGTSRPPSICPSRELSLPLPSHASSPGQAADVSAPHGRQARLLSPSAAVAAAAACRSAARQPALDQLPAQRWWLPPPLAPSPPSAVPQPRATPALPPTCLTTPASPTNHPGLGFNDNMPQICTPCAPAVHACRMPGPSTMPDLTGLPNSKAVEA